MVFFLLFFGACKTKKLGVALYEMDKAEIPSWTNVRESIGTNIEKINPKENIQNLKINTNTQAKNVVAKDSLQKQKNVIDTQKIVQYSIIKDSIVNLPKNKNIGANPNNNLLPKNTNIQNAEMSPQKIAFLVDSVLRVREQYKFSNSTNPNTNQPNTYQANPTQIQPQEKIINNYYYYYNQQNPNKDSLKKDSLKKDTLKKDTLGLKKDSLKKDTLTLKKSILQKDTLQKDSTKIIAKTQNLADTTKNQNVPKIKENILALEKDTPKKDTLKENPKEIVKETKKNQPKTDTLKISAYYETNALKPINEIAVLKALDMLEVKDKKLLEVYLSGYTDRQGYEQKNKILSQNRVLWLKEYILGKKVDEKLIFMQYFGQKYASTKIDNPQERRVEILVIWENL